MVTYTVMSLSTVRKTCVFQRIQAEKEESEGGELAKDEEEKAEAGEVEKERGVMPEDEEVRAGRWRRKHISAVTVTKTIVESCEQLR